jgi:hypothetical protein
VAESTRDTRVWTLSIQSCTLFIWNYYFMSFQNLLIFLYTFRCYDGSVMSYFGYMKLYLEKLFSVTQQGHYNNHILIFLTQVIGYMMQHFE